MTDRSPIEKILIGCVIVSLTSLCLAVLLLRSGVLFKSYRNRSTSMEPTVPKDALLIIRRTRMVSRGELVALLSPKDPDVTFAKRLIAVGGDSVEIRDKRVFVNGVELHEPYAQHLDEHTYPELTSLPDPYRLRDQMARIVVPAESFFVLGDNRDYSADSRYWGTVPRANIIGRVVLAIDGGRGVWRPR